MPLAAAPFPLPPPLATLLAVVLNLSPSLPVPFRSHVPALAPSCPSHCSQLSPSRPFRLSLLTSLRSLLAFPFRPRPFLHPSSPCRACPGRDPGRGPSTMRNPGAPRPPLATQPDQMLPTSFPPTHSSALYPLPFSNTPTRQKNPPKLSPASRRQFPPSPPNQSPPPAARPRPRPLPLPAARTLAKAAATNPSSPRRACPCLPWT